MHFIGIYNSPFENGEKKFTPIKNIIISLVRNQYLHPFNLKMLNGKNQLKCMHGTPYCYQ